MTRPAVVQKLVEDAYHGMLETAGKASGDEVLSACLTLAHRAVKLSIMRGADLTDVRQAVEGMWAMLPPEVPRA